MASLYEATKRRKQENKLLKKALQKTVTQNYVGNSRNKSNSKDTQGKTKKWATASKTPAAPADQQKKEGKGVTLATVQATLASKEQEIESDSDQ